MFWGSIICLPAVCRAFQWSASLPRIGDVTKPDLSPAKAASCGDVLASLLCSENGVNASEVASACASSVVWEDMASKTYEGPAAVEAMLAAKFPPTSRLAAERTAGDATTGGLTWHREAIGGSTNGLRGTLYGRLEDGKIQYVREGCEPLFKLGKFIEGILKAASANNADKPEPTYAKANPTTAKAIVEYLWCEAYPKGATPDVALDLFDRDIVYEDFNYDEPFVGKPAVKDFVEAFDIPGIAFVPEEISGGDKACCFTWKLTVNGQNATSGISFYEVGDNGKVVYIRDIPAVAPAPLQQIAAQLDPDLRKVPVRGGFSTSGARRR